MTPLGKAGEYTIRVQGRVDIDLATWFGPGAFVADQPGIVGFVRHLHGLGVLLLSIQRIEPV